MRVASRIDTNQPRMVRRLRELGFHIVHLHMLGRGVPDVLVSAYSNRTERVEALLVEIKTDKGTLTDDERTWHESYPEGGPLIVARNEDDVLHWFGR
jgi:hypothetical protein